MRSTLSSGTRVQYTQPPNGSLNGVPSTSTSVRLTPLGPMPRSDTPCAVGCDDRLLVRRKRLKVGICRSTSSATTAGDILISSLCSTFTLAAMSPSRCSVRDAVTVTSSRSVAGLRMMSSAREPSLTRSVFSANPPARTMTVTSPVALVSTANRPSGPVITRCSGPDAARTMTRAPDTTPPVESCTTPEIEEAAKARMNAAITVFLQNLYRNVRRSLPHGSLVQRKCNERRILAAAGGDDDELTAVRRAIRHRRADRAAVQIDGREMPIRRFEQWQAVHEFGVRLADARELGVDLRRPRVRARSIGLADADDVRLVRRLHEQHSRSRIERAAAPVRAADESRPLHGALKRGRREQRSDAVLAELFPRRGPRLRCQIERIVERDALF